MNVRRGAGGQPGTVEERVRVDDDGVRDRKTRV